MKRDIGFGGILVRSLAVLFVLIGLVLAIGGAWLLYLGGSPYYVAAGGALMVSGLLLGRLRLPASSYTCCCSPPPLSGRCGKWA